MEWIYENSELITVIAAVASVIAAIASIFGVFVPFIIRRIEKKEREKELLDEYEIREGMSKFPMTYEERNYFAQKEILNKKQKK